MKQWNQFDSFGPNEHPLGVWHVRVVGKKWVELIPHIYARRVYLINVSASCSTHTHTHTHTHTYIYIYIHCRPHLALIAMSPLAPLLLCLLALESAVDVRGYRSADVRLADILSRYRKQYGSQSSRRPCDYLVYHGYRKCCLKYPDDPCSCNGIVAICAEAMEPHMQDVCRVIEQNGELCCRKRPGEYCKCPEDAPNMCWLMQNKNYTLSEGRQPIVFATKFRNSKISMKCIGMQKQNLHCISVQITQLRT